MQVDKMDTMDTMDKEYIEEFDVINRYNQNRLSDEELNRFEIYILEHPEIIPVIEKDKIIREAFRENEELLKEASGEKEQFPWVRGLAMAACLVVAVVAVFNFSGQQEYTLQPPVILETFRGAGDNAVQVDGQPIVRFQIDMGPVAFIDSNAFTAELIDSSGNSQFGATGLSVDADGWLFFSLTAQEQPLTGAYEVRVYPDNSPDAATAYNVEFSSR